jgi:hypothetical protein
MQSTVERLFRSPIAVLLVSTAIGIMGNSPAPAQELLATDSRRSLARPCLEHLKHFRVFLFGQKIYLEIEMISLIRLDVAAVLAHQDEQRKKNRFRRDDRGQQLEGKRIEGKLALRVAIKPAPNGETDCVKNDEPHLPCMRGDNIA